MSRNEIILGAVALVLVLFSIVVSMVIPRRRPDFPGNRLKLFTLVAVLLVVATLTSVEIFGVEEGQGEAHNEGEVTEVQDSGEPDAESPTTTGAEGGGGGGDTAAAEELFAAQGCGNCHTFEPAGASGTIGPSLDETNMSAEEAADQIENGGQQMPAFGDQLSPEEIQALAEYVTGAGSR